MQRMIGSAALRIGDLLSPGSPTALSRSRSWSDDGQYTEFCLRAALNARSFKSFRRSRVYRRILEHVNEEQGLGYLKAIERDTPAFLNSAVVEQVRENDFLGRPQTYMFPVVGRMSPTTLRYLKVCSDLRGLFGSLEGFSIAEIGGGYGGQCVVIDKIWRTREYRLFDLDPVLMLAARYLEHFLLRTSYVPLTLNRYRPTNPAADLVISNYAFSELPRPLQDKYLDRLILSAQRGYLTMNSGKDVSVNGENTAAELLEQIPSSILLPEEPLTGQGNYIIAWGPHLQEGEKNRTISRNPTAG